MFWTLWKPQKQGDLEEQVTLLTLMYRYRQGDIGTVGAAVAAAGKRGGVWGLFSASKLMKLINLFTLNISKILNNDEVL